MTVLRPINVAFKNKWLRDASRDLDKTISLDLVNQQGYQRLSSISTGSKLDPLLLYEARIKQELGLPDFVVDLASKISKYALQVMKRDSFETIHELLACYILAIKLLFGLNDSKTESFTSFLDSVKQAVLRNKRPEPIFWRIQDMNEISDVR